MWEVNSMFVSRKLEKNFGAEVSQMLHKYIKFDNGKFSCDQSNMTENENAIDLLFARWYDIEQTFSYICFCKIYINSFKYYPKVSKVYHLHFIYEAYLNHIFSLRDKIKALTKVTKRFLRNHEEDEIVKQTIDLMNKTREIYEECFKNEIVARDHDVHAIKYFPEDIHKVAGYEYMIETDLKTPEYKMVFKNELKILKKKYKNIFISGERDIKKILSAYFNLLNKLLFKEQYIRKVSSKDNKIGDRKEKTKKDHKY